MSSATRSKRLVVRETSTLLDAEIVEAFLAASCDDNPVHRDSDLTRRQLGGRAVAFGGLSVLCGLDLANAQGVDVAAFRAQFLHPVAVGDRLDCRVVEFAADGVLTVHGEVEGRRCLTLTVSSRASDVTTQDSGEVLALPEPRTAARLQTAFPGVDGSMLSAICALSWFAGSREPGAGSVLGSIEIERKDEGSDREELRIDTRTARLRGALAERAGAISTRGSRFGFRFISMPPRAVPALDGAAIAAALAPAEGQLEGRRILVLGGTRGLGGAASLAFAAAGAAVDAVYRRGDTEAEALAGTRAGGSITTVKLDLDRPGTLSGSLRLLPGATGGYDGVVYGISAGIHPGRMPGAETTRGHLGAALTTAWGLLEEASGVVRKGGWLCFVSSAAVEDCPPDWHAYGMEKAAGEWLTRTVCRDAEIGALVVRPPLLDSEFSAKVDPFARRVRVEGVAVALVRAVLDGPTTGDGVIVVPIESSEDVVG